MSIVEGLRALPLFQGLPIARLEELVGGFARAQHRSGTVLFRPGDPATHFWLLVSGEVSIQEQPTSTEVAAAKVALRPIVAVGEVGALTGLPRSTTATAESDVELLSINAGDLLGYFGAHPDAGFTFYRNVFGVLGDKIRRDRSRVDDMRTNIVRTQKAMKQMRDIVLSSPETAISRPIFDSLDTMIASNRRANYRVTPTASYPAHVRADDGRIVRVLEVSEGYLKVDGRAQDLVEDPTYWTGVLVLPGAEVLLSGSVAREDEGSVLLKLDPPIDEFKAKLDDYSMRVQLLDFAV